MTQDLELSLERREKSAIERISQAENDATAEVKILAADIALNATQRLLIESINDDKADALIDSSIAELEKKLNFGFATLVLACRNEFIDFIDNKNDI